VSRGADRALKPEERQDERHEIRVRADLLEQFTIRVLESAGLSTLDAVETAHGLVEANLCGVDSHGVMRLRQYVDCLQGGEINPRADVRVVNCEGAVALLDADGGYGYRPSNLAVDLLVERARELGAAFVGVRNSHHFGMAALYTRRGAAAGMVTFVWTNSSARIAPWGATGAVTGNNPLSWAVPRRPPLPPIVLDTALTTVAFGKIRLAHVEGRSEIPAGWGLSSDGRPTTSAAEAFASGLLAPIGEYKGYGLSLIGELVAGVMTGSPFGTSSKPHSNPLGGVGHIFLGVDPSRFVSAEAFADGVDQLVEEIRGARRDAGAEVYLPGEIEDRTRSERLRRGIPLFPLLVDVLVELGAGAGAPTDFLAGPGG
jgi:LDH2 family malate/lactate/ureidoglycolate dehydrogenase